MAGFDVLVILVIICMCNRIRLAVAVIQCSADYVREVMSALFVPLIFLVAKAILFTFCIVVGCYIYTSAEIDRSDSLLPFMEAILDTKTRLFLFYHIFASFWTIAFLLSVSQFVKGSACAIWYFRRSSGIKYFPVTVSFYRAFVFHTGSLAFGSFILAIVWTVQTILAYLTVLLILVGIHTHFLDSSQKIRHNREALLHFEVSLVHHQRNNRRPHSP